MPMKLGIIGCGLKAASYARSWVTRAAPPSLVAITDPSEASMARYGGIVAASGAPAPKRYASVDELFAAERGNLDAVYISTPHCFHQGYAEAALRNGLHVLLEKPMAMNAGEARSIIKARDEADRKMVVAYQSSLSPLIFGYRQRAASGEFGALLNISGEVWEHWRSRYTGNWKQEPALSGGGFIFDTGSHLFNAVLQATGKAYRSVCAHLDNRGEDYELVGGVLATLDGGVPVNLAFCGDTTTGCESALTLFYEKAILRLDIWGKWAELRQGLTITRETGGDANDEVLDAFIRTVDGTAANPSPAEQSLHLAELWDLIKESSAQHGTPMRLSTRPEVTQ